MILIVSLFFAICSSIPMHENDAIAFKRIVELWELANTDYEKALDDCPTSNANVQCFGASTPNPAKRQRIRYFRAVGNKHLQQKAIPKVRSRTLSFRCCFCIIVEYRHTKTGIRSVQIPRRSVVEECRSQVDTSTTAGSTFGINATRFARQFVEWRHTS